MPNEWDRRVLDVVIHTTGAVQGVPWALVESQPPVSDRIELGNGVWVGKIGSELAQKTMDACDPPGFVHHPPTRQYGELYSYVRERIMPLSESFGWDEDQRVQTCVALSRLVHPTTLSLEYSARIVLRLDGGVDEIIPGPVMGFGSQVWLPTTNNYRNWLTEKDTVDLRKLLGIYPTLQGLPKRVGRALWYFQYAMQTYYLDVRWTLVCIALEALVHTGNRDSTLHFKRRIPQLAREFGITLTEDDAKRAYNERSSLAHGQGLLTPIAKTDSADNSIMETGPDTNLYPEIENILRTAVLVALQDREFQEIFCEDTKISARWPT
jgi:hypothetical protein